MWNLSYGISNILKKLSNLQNNLRVVELIHCKKVMEKYLIVKYQQCKIYLIKITKS